MSTPLTSQASCKCCWEVTQIYPSGQSPELFLAAKTRSRGQLVRWLWTFNLLVATCAQVGMLARFLGSLWCPQLPPAPEAGIHTYVRLTCRGLAKTWQRRMRKDEPLVRNLSFLDKRKRLIGSVAIVGYDSSTPTKTLGQLWLTHNGSKIKFRFG